VKKIPAMAKSTSVPTTRVAIAVAKILKFLIIAALNAIAKWKNGAFFRCKYDGTTEKMLGTKERKKKMTKHEERKLVKKYSQADEEVESPLAAALKAALGQSEE